MLCFFHTQPLHSTCFSKNSNGRLRTSRRHKLVSSQCRVSLPCNLHARTNTLCHAEQVVLEQGCQIDSFGAKNQKFGSFEKQLAQKFLFGYLATFWLFCNFFVPQIFHGEELRVVRVACSRHHKMRSGTPYSCVMLNEHPNVSKKR